jgi:hypothetical protein
MVKKKKGKVKKSIDKHSPTYFYCYDAIFLGVHKQFEVWGAALGGSLIDFFQIDQSQRWALRVLSFAKIFQCSDDVMQASVLFSICGGKGIGFAKVVFVLTWIPDFAA